MRVDRLIALAEDAGAAKAVRLQVGAAFHSELMQSVQARMGEAIGAARVKDPAVPIVANASGRLVTRAEDVRRALVDQIASPVRWVDCVRTLRDAGCTRFVELGPGRVLAGLIRQIDRGADVITVETPAKLEELGSTHIARTA